MYNSVFICYFRHISLLGWSLLREASYNRIIHDDILVLIQGAGSV